MLAIVLAVIFVTLMLVLVRGLIVMLLWNWVMPVVFAVPELSYLQAIGLALLVSTLIGFGNPAQSTKKAEK